MRFHSAISDLDSTADATQQVVEQIRARMEDVDAAFVFFTPDHAGQIEQAVERLWLELDPQVIVGCSAEGVIGADQEIERTAGLSVLAGHLPGVRVHPIHIATNEWAELLHAPDDLRERLGCGPETRAVVGFGDPWTTPLMPFMQALDLLAPRAPLIGGMASGARSAGENRLVRNDQVFDQGFVGMSLSGEIEVQSVVSQGARPIGKPLVITRCRENVIEQLGGKPAVEVLRETIQRLTSRDEQLLRHGLLIGRVVSEYRERFGRGDFLVRNVVGFDADNQAIEVAEHVRTGQTVQFHVRDAASADEDLRLLLQSATETGTAAAALLFSCNGRGTRMFDAPNHDIAVSRELMPDTPVGGFFAAGEFGPVGGRNFIHGHTASFALLRKP